MFVRAPPLGLLGFRQVVVSHELGLMALCLLKPEYLVDLRTYFCGQNADRRLIWAVSSPPKLSQICRSSDVFYLIILQSFARNELEF